MGQQSVLHAVKARSKPISKRSLNVPTSSLIEEDPNEEHDASRPLAQTLTDLQFSDSPGDKTTEKGTPIRNKYLIIYVSLTHSLAVNI